MASPDYNSFSAEELRKKVKAQKTVTGILIGSILVMIISGIYITFTKGFGVFSVTPVAFLPLLIINMNSMKQMKKALEEKERSLQQ